MKNGGDNSSFSFPYLALSENDSSSIEDFENLRNKRAFFKITDMIANIFDKFRFSGHDTNIRKQISHNNIILRPILFECF